MAWLKLKFIDAVAINPNVTFTFQYGRFSIQNFVVINMEGDFHVSNVQINPTTFLFTTDINSSHKGLTTLPLARKSSTNRDPVLTMTGFQTGTVHAIWGTSNNEDREAPLVPNTPLILDDYVN
jgi:hypothetical protein